MKKFYRLSALFVIILHCLTFSVSGQEEKGGLYLTGKITTEKGDVDKAIMKMTRNGQAMKDYNVLPDGKFNLRFEFNNDYALIFTRSGNFPQKVIISTTVPGDVLRRDRKFPPFPLDINLFTEIKGIDRTFSENAILKIFYSSSVDNFISEVYYNNPQIKKLIDQAIWQSQNVNKESDLLKKLSAAELAEMRKEYEEYLMKAGTEFDKQDYISALEDYKSASRIFPNEQFPKDRIAEINDLIGVLGLQSKLEQKEKERYDGVIVLADKAFNEKLWDQAKTRYQEALEIRPGESYPVSQIARIDQELQDLASLADKKAGYDAAVLNGDAAFEKQFYSKAIAFYRTALTFKPGDQIVLDKIAKTEMEQKKINDKLVYDETIANADKAFDKKAYKEARELYATAFTAMPGIPYPQKQIEIIDQILDKLKRYDQLIASGDLEFNDKDYIKAKEDFKNALTIKPDEKYPSQKIRDIDLILAGLAKADQEYKQILAGADQFMRDDKLIQARAEYKKAAAIRPDDPYPVEMMNKISAMEAEQLRLAAEKDAAEKAGLLAQLNETNQKYKSLVDEADSLAGQNMLPEAVGKFRAALEVKPKESYPLRRIEEIRGIIARQMADKKAYDTAVAQGDQAYGKQQFSPARSAYQQALQLKKDEKYPKEMLSRIDSIEAMQARLAAEEKAKEEAARQAAEAVKVKLAKEAEDARLAAIAEKARIAALNKAREDSARQAVEAEKARLAKAAEDARLAAEAEKARVAAEKKAKDEAALQAAEAEKARVAKAAEDARLTAVPEKVLTNEDEVLYDSYISSADQAFTDKEYNVSRAWYYKALGVEPENRYPAGRIEEINRIIGTMQLSQVDREFQQYIDKGDEAFRGNEPAVARSWYNRALTVKPNDNYSKSQLVEIQLIINERLQGNTEKTFSGYMEQGNKAIDLQQYNVARVWYQRAQQLKPANRQPREKLEEIRKALGK